MVDEASLTLFMKVLFNLRSEIQWILYHQESSKAENKTSKSCKFEQTLNFREEKLIRFYDQRIRF
jgi:hypothetical protein